MRRHAGEFEAIATRRSGFLSAGAFWEAFWHECIALAA
jgi:hypothetical protein